MNKNSMNQNHMTELYNGQVAVPREMAQMLLQKPRVEVREKRRHLNKRGKQLLAFVSIATAIGGAQIAKNVYNFATMNDLQKMEQRGAKIEDYTVKPGDTLNALGAEIGDQTGVANLPLLDKTHQGVNAINEANAGTNVSNGDLRVGETIKIPIIPNK